jgi:hypothetical protein
MMRKIVLNYIPNWVYLIQFKKLMQYRPQADWLPKVGERVTNGAVAV